MKKKNKIISEVNRIKYVKDNNECPYCGSSDIVGDDVEFLDTIITREVSCEDCEGRWVETFKLIGVNERN